MERLTDRSAIGNAFYPHCFGEKGCAGDGDRLQCSKCDFDTEICERLAAYEDTNLTPEQMLEIDRAYRELCEKLNKYQQLEEDGLILPAPLNGVDRFTLDGNTWWVRADAETEHKDYIEQVANMLGVQLNEEFKIRPTEKAKLLGVRENDKTFRFDTALVYKGYDDGWSKWYGFGCEHVLYYLLLGYYEVDRAGIKEIGE